MPVDDEDRSNTLLAGIGEVSDLQSLWFFAQLRE
jgi:hypothetical protein